MTGKIITKAKTTEFEVIDGCNIALDCLDNDYIHVWPDGGGNCGPVSIGIVVVENGIVRQTHGEYLGDSMTNNIAELTAILRGLQLVKSKHKPVKIYSDSNYSLRSISGAFNGRKNRALIDGIVEYVKNYPVEITFVKVKGHAKLPFNEMADSIASWFLQHATTMGRKTKKKATKVEKKK